MVAIFREAKRVLRNDGTVWLNLGDTYSGPKGDSHGSKRTKGLDFGNASGGERTKNLDMENGNLVGIPWRVALALQADGWILRSDIIWHKSNPMPESVQNRCTKAHEYLFMFSKRSNYYYDNEAVRDEFADNRMGNPGNYKATLKECITPMGVHGVGVTGNGWNVNGDAPGKNKRSVWSIEDEQKLVQWLATNEPDTLERFLKESTNKPDVWKIATQGYLGAHFAVYPPRLIEPCVKAGTSEYGCCANCGDPYIRITERKGARVQNTNAKRDRSVGNRNGTGDSTLDGERPEVETIGWERKCYCDTTEVVPCTVLDPFMGAATTAIVSIGLCRRVWGIELSKKYILCNQIPRIEGELRSRPALEDLIPERK